MQPQLDEDGMLPDPHGHLQFLNPDLATFAQLQACPCLVLLGPPGLGKSTALRAAYDATEGEKIHVDLASYSDQSSLDRALFGSPQICAWLQNDSTLHLFIDS